MSGSYSQGIGQQVICKDLGMEITGKVKGMRIDHQQNVPTTLDKNSSKQKWVEESKGYMSSDRHKNAV